MLQLPTVLTMEDFNLCNWQDIIDESEKKDCLRYESRFFKKAREARESGDLKAEGVFALFGVVSSFILNLDSKEMPFGPFMALEGSRAAIPSDVTDEQLALLKELVPSISDGELRARIADVLWVRNCGHKVAECAVESYLESAKTLEQIGHWAPLSNRLERALQLAVALNNRTLLPKVVEHIEGLLQRCDNDRNQIPTLDVTSCTQE
jgi:hypothetical protein